MKRGRRRFASISGFKHAIFGALIFAAIIAGGWAMKVELKDLLGAAATLLAAYTGATAAFEFSARHQAAERRAAEIAAVNRAIMGLLMRFISLETIYRDHMADVANSSGRHFELRPTLPMFDVGPFDFRSLEFLIPGNTTVLADLHLNDLRFREAVQAYNARSTFFLEVVQPKVTATVPPGTMADLAALEGALGAAAAIQLESMTSIAFFHFERTLNSIVEAKEALREAAKAHAPGVKFVDFNPKFPLPDDPADMREPVPRGPQRKGQAFAHAFWDWMPGA